MLLLLLNQTFKKKTRLQKVAINHSKSLTKIDETLIFLWIIINTGLILKNKHQKKKC